MIDLAVGDPLSSQVGSKALQGDADVVDFVQVFNRKIGNGGAFIGREDDQAFARKFYQGLPDGRPAYAKQTCQLILRETIPGLEVVTEDQFSQLIYDVVLGCGTRNL